MQINVNDNTLRKSGVDFNLEYGSGAVRGYVYAGPVNIAGAIASMNFGVSSIEVGFQFNSDGVVGLAFNPLNHISVSLKFASYSFPSKKENE